MEIDELLVRGKKLVARARIYKLQPFELPYVVVEQQVLHVDVRLVVRRD